MAKYLSECKKVKEMIDEAFPTGMSRDQVEAIQQALRATVTVRNHATMDNAVRALFPDAKWGSNRVHSERLNKDFDIMTCVEGYELEPKGNPFQDVEVAEEEEQSEPKSDNPFR